MNAELALTGIGVTSAIGQGQAAFADALMRGAHAFGVMRREGRQKNSAFLGAEIGTLAYPDAISRTELRTASFSSHVAVVTVYEAWRDANLDAVDPTRIGLIVGGSNFQQRDLVRTYETQAARPQFLRPTHGLGFIDTDLCGVCTEQFGIRGAAYTVGGASASGLLAIIQAMQAVQSGMVDVCIAVGALMDLSYWEFQGLRSLGAMGSDRYATEPALACRPFDRSRDGFIFGECCGAVVVEKAASIGRSGVKPYARLSGWGLAMDANRNPNPSLEGEMEVIRQALRRASVEPARIDYINTHGTASMVGDETELKALHASGLSHAYINATKSLTGHGLTAAGAVEVVATALQMRLGRLHPTRNLEDPIEPALRWVKAEPVNHSIECALKLSMGFGGINTALCLERIS